jgi:hypothetical protein
MMTPADILLPTLKLTGTLVLMLALLEYIKRRFFRD